MKDKTIIITGASSGLGAALAKGYARLEAKKIYLLGRSELRLNEIVLECKKIGTEAQEVIGVIVDVTDQFSIQKIIDDIASKGPIDLLIAAAGVSENSLKAAGYLGDYTSAIFNTNINGVINSLEPTIKYMQKQGFGQIAVIGSLAGLVSIADSVAYSSSKAAINSYTNGIRVALKASNINVSLIMPGYITTPMTDVNKFSMPLKYSAEEAANIIIKGLNRKRGLIIFPKILYFALKLLNILPYRFIDYLNKRIMNKEQNVDTHK